MRGFALGAACDIPIGSPIENVKALCNAVLEKDTQSAKIAQ
jgi:hypothetical protein